MARVYKNTDEDLGMWMKHNGKFGEEEGWIQVKIIEFSDGFARTVGQNIPIEEFEKNYKRADEISAGPWSNLNPASLGINLNELGVTPLEEPDQQITIDNVSSKEIVQQSLRQNIRDTQQIINIQDDNISAEHQLIRNAIRLSKNTSKVSIVADYEIPFDLAKVQTIVDTMEIDSSIVVDVVMEQIKRNPEGFYASIEIALQKLIGVKDSKSEK